MLHNMLGTMLGARTRERLGMLRRFQRAWVVCAVLGLLSLVGVAVYTRTPLIFVSNSLHGSWRLPFGSSYNVPMSCDALKDIVFLKTHKCASSTVMNIFLRYGVTHNLTFVLPTSKVTHYIGHPVPFNHNLITDMRRYNYSNNILTHHTRFNKAEISYVMPKDSVYVTILRRPEDVFESLYAYCRLSKKYHKSLTEFVNDDHALKLMNRKRVIEGKIGFNQMCFDLGMKTQDVADDNAVRNFINFIAENFNLVMIAERFDESLILLKHLLCWTTEDMVAFKINARLDKYKEELSPEVKKRLRQFNGGDVKLYDYFSKLFDQKVAEFGVDRMAEEVHELRSLRNAYYERCVDREDTLDKVVPEQNRKEVIAFKKKEDSELCRYMTLTELEFHDLLLKRQKDMIHDMIRSRIT
ncbi:galactosylceramide sulfotransferase-like isoform X2 [Ornithodoros turicata]